MVKKKQAASAAAAAAEPAGAEEEAVEEPARKKARPAAKKKAAEPKPKAPHYLLKTEPAKFSIDDLAAKENQTDGWDGVRNAVARNNMRAMALNETGFLYHSMTKVPAIVGIVKVVREAYPDPTAFDPSSDGYDKGTSPHDPKWWQVDVQLVRKLRRPITLEELKGHKEGPLAGMALFKQSRLSVQPVSEAEWEFILGLEDQEPPAPQPKPRKARAPAGGGAKGGRKGKKAAADAEEAEDGDSS